MTVFAHGFAALVYIALAAAVAYALPRGGFGIETSAATVVGAAVAVVGVFLHNLFVRARGDRSLANVLRTLRAAQIKIEKALDASRGEVRQLVVAFDKAAQNLTGDGGKELAAEMRVLQTLLKQSVSRHVRDDAPPPPAPVVPVPSAMPRDADSAQLLGIIHDALDENRVDVYLQPVVSLPQRKHMFYETFSRLREADGAQIEPARYLAAAESAGLIAAIDNNLLFRCIQIVRKAQRRSLKLGFFCNISSYTLRDTSFFPEFIDFIERNDQLASSLIFEFALADLASHDEEIVGNLDRLDRMGFRFSVDRVDTVALDVRLLTERHVSFVKIDAGKLLDSLKDGRRVIELQNTKRRLDQAGIYLVVEKVEEEQQLVELLDYGIDFGQGYLFGSPRLSREGE